MIARLPEPSTNRLLFKSAAALFLGLALQMPCAGQSSGTALNAKDETKKLYRRLCQGCHGADGKGDSDARGLPDFTRRAWHQRKEDATLVVSILEGKGDIMPAFSDRLTMTQAKELLVHIRAFAPKAPAKEQAEDKSLAEFKREFEELQKEYQQIHDQLLEISAREKPSKQKPKAESEKEGSSKKVEESLRSAKILYRDRCQRCHGEDGKGIAGKLDCKEPPDFNRRAWQEKRSDAQLIKSIVDGKDGAMPGFRKHLSDEQVRDLVDYIRSLTPPRRANLPLPKSNPSE